MYIKFTFTKCDAPTADQEQTGVKTSNYTHRSPIIIDELPNVKINTLIHSDANDQEYFYILDCECEDKGIVMQALQTYQQYVFDNQSCHLSFQNLEEKVTTLVDEMKRDLIGASLQVERDKIDATFRRNRYAFYLFGGIAVASASVAVVNYIRENYQP